MRLTAALFTLESAFGSVQPSAHPGLDALTRDAKDAKAERVREMRGA